MSKRRPHLVNATRVLLQLCGLFTRYRSHLCPYPCSNVRPNKTRLTLVLFTKSHLSSLCIIGISSTTTVQDRFSRTSLSRLDGSVSFFLFVSCSSVKVPH